MNQIIVIKYLLILAVEVSITVEKQTSRVKFREELRWLDITED